jgi:hypothetical protein
MFRYRLLYPMPVDQYLDEPCDEIEWALHIAELRGVTPWIPKRGDRDDAGPR